MISAPRQDTSRSSQKYFRQCCHRKLVFTVFACLGFWNMCDSWPWDVAKIQTLAAQPRTSWALAFFFRFTVPKADSVSNCKRGWQRFALDCSHMFWDKWTLQCVKTKTCPCKGFRITLRVLFFKSPHPSSQVVFLACHGSHHERNTIQRTHLLSGMGSSRQRVRRYCYGSY